MLNVAVIMGRLVATPELRTTPSGVSVCSFRVAVDRSYSSRDGGERQTDFIDVVAWRNTAEFVCRYFQKGQMIAVNGRIQTRNYEDKQGNKRTAVEIVADNVNFCGSKRESGGDESYGNYGGGLSAPRNTSRSSPAPEAPADEGPAPAYSSGDSDDFDDVLEDNDLPF